MPAAFEVTIQGEFRSQMTINRLCFYTGSAVSTVVGAFQLAQALGYQPSIPAEPLTDSVLFGLTSVQTPSYVMQKLYVRNLYSVTDFWQGILTGAGWAGQSPDGGSGALPFVATKLQTNRIRTDVRAGTLALTPFGETNMDAEGDLSTAALEALADLCNWLNAPPSFTAGSDTASYLPSVFKKEKYIPEGNDADQPAYRYPDSLDALVGSSAIGVTWSPVPRATSQTSRRFGKGR